MCVNPLKIRNPYHGSQPFVFSDGCLSKCDSRFVPSTPYITVPCGQCADCRASYFESIRQRVIVESLTSYVYFITLTYDDDHLPYLEFTSNCGLQKIYYADISHVQQMFKRLRNVDYLQDRDFRYLGVTEYGSERSRPHHHLILFVARKLEDDFNTSRALEKYLYDDIKRFYALNIGTRKNPVYEPLFTHVTKVIKGKVHSNYSCTLVVDRSSESQFNDVVNTPESISKVCTYLIGYVNKTSRYSELLEKFIADFSNYGDDLLLKRVKDLLRCRTYYSKHLGFGFHDGKKVSPSYPNFILTSQMATISEDLFNLPSNLIGLSIFYPNIYRSYSLFKNKVENFLLVSQPSSYRSLREKFFSADDSFYLALASKVEPKWLSTVTHNLWNLSDYHIRVLPKGVYDPSYKSSKSFQFIRKGVENGLTNKVQYLAFYDFCSSVPCYKPLCKYYKRYCTDLHDISRLYDILKVENYDEYVASIEFDELSYERRSIRQKLNEARCDQSLSDDDEKNLTVKNNAIYLHYSKKVRIFVPTSKTIDDILHF